ncbi:MAG: dihydropteroate synthase [Burkholderiales bacterium PBB3]|nr:MAG: dihydropteroate synthase [Burkholderiales bacterium PBB3]
MHWQTTRFSIDLRSPQVMGIVNVTPDSFSDGGQHASQNAAMAWCDKLLKDGANILDIGGESTRPGAPQVPQDEELARVLPIVRYAVTLGVPVSVDTYKPAVMQAALDLGADIINDVWALRWAGSEDLRTGMDVVREHPNCGMCLMHMHRDPQTMQVTPMAGDAVPQVLLFLEHLGQEMSGLGVDKTRICIDPGIGFGKTVAQNFALLARQHELIARGYPVLAGWSRKSSLAAVTQRSLSDVATLDVRERLVPSVTAALLAVQNGAHIVRVHDVKETVQALNVWAAMQQQKVSE